MFLKHLIYKRTIRFCTGKSPTTFRKLPIRNTRLAKIFLSRIDVEDKASNHKKSDAKALENSTESLLLQMCMKREIMLVTHGPTLLKTEQEHKSVTRSIDRAVSLSRERKNYIQDYPLGEKGRECSMQRDLTKPLQEDETDVKREKEINRVDKSQEWGKWIGTCLLIFILPLSVILPQFLCSKGQCKTALVKLSIDWKSYINLYSLSYVAFLILLTCTSIIPIGKTIDGQQSKTRRLQYCVNGYLSTIVMLIGLGLYIYMNISVSNYIINNIVQFSISSWIVGTILAVELYIKGREINPRIGTLDIKLLLIRASLIGMLIVNIAIAIKAVDDVKSSNIEELDIATLLVVLLQLFYVIHGLIYEAFIFTSFTIMYKETGYMTTCISHLLYSFLTTLTAKYILYHKLKFNYFTGTFVLSFVIGYALYRINNCIKMNSERIQFCRQYLIWKLFLSCHPGMMPQVVLTRCKIQEEKHKDNICSLSGNTNIYSNFNNLSILPTVNDLIEKKVNNCFMDSSEFSDLLNTEKAIESDPDYVQGEYSSVTSDSEETEGSEHENCDKYKKHFSSTHNNDSTGISSGMDVSNILGNKYI
ncbi:delta(14)-sterol reductase LBR-like isoform X2 [Monomorium pharaonis]|uniref:delta(14)-sterol reductase LBR-like isoform X2 n=1 Tax=Monomorium pharaonis TaxID=307658 RepID=UPI0017475A2F|nr:delta(14)-sterol reductase LBR-like isoform X2 [Monomorium pharaonis]